MDRSRAEELLTRERERLERLGGFAHRQSEQSQVESATSNPEPHDAADTAVAATAREHGLSLEEHVAAQLENVEGAFQRLEAGTYGRCEACGTTIADERLEAVPATRFCVEHQDELERFSAADRGTRTD
jgi:RNA polymerase-binding transcription factor DksA